MGTLLKSATIIAPGSKHHGTVKDILVEGQNISSIQTNISNHKGKTIDCKGKYVSSGWVDLRAHFRDPGEEYKENIESGLLAAAKGGFTKVVLMPSTNPPIADKSSINYLLSKSSNGIVDVLPCGALSKNLEGCQLSEMFDMSLAGAATFGDDKYNVSTSLMNRALEYSSGLNKPIMSFPIDCGLNPGGTMHEGSMSTSLGLTGTSSAAEAMRLSRDIQILKYAGGKLIANPISCRESVEQIKHAKKENIAVTATVTAMHLMFTDEDLASFDTRLKVNPPFRTPSDRKALIKGLAQGNIEAICSDHSPEDVEHKKTEFEHAKFGISSIEHTFAVANTVLKDELQLDEIIAKFTSGPRAMLGLDQHSIETGNKAELTIFDPNSENEIKLSDMISLSNNSPLGGKILHGKVIAVLNNGKVQTFD